MEEPRYTVSYNYVDPVKGYGTKTIYYQNVNELESFIYDVDGYHCKETDEHTKIFQYTVTIKRKDWELEDDED